jgi:hypothetical protein
MALSIGPDRHSHFMNEPVRIDFAGFASDTYRLGRCGWQFALGDIDRSDYHYGSRTPFGLHHKVLDITAYGYLRHRSGYHRDGEAIGIVDRLSVTKTMFFNVAPGMMAMSLRETIPELADRVYAHEHSIGLPVFSKLHERPEVQELIVEPMDVQRMLDLILQTQAPERQAMRQREARRDGVQARQVHAQIVSLAA